jgi:hypothetical protein
MNSSTYLTPVPFRGATFPPCCAALWNKDKVGGSVKKGRQVVYGKLSMLGGLAINDAADFSRVFGRMT